MAIPDTHVVLPHKKSGVTVYARITNSNLFRRNDNGVFEVLVEANVALYAHPSPEQGSTPASKIYVLDLATLPSIALIADDYGVIFYEQAGGVPTLVDKRIGVWPGQLSWDGNKIISHHTLDIAIQNIENVGIGPGADQVTLQVCLEDGVTPVADADIWITTDAAGNNVIAGTLQTDSAGKATFLLDAGVTYWRWVQKDGFTFNNPRKFVAVAD